MSRLQTVTLAIVVLAAIIAIPRLVASHERTPPPAEARTPPPAWEESLNFPMSATWLGSTGPRKPDSERHYAAWAICLNCSYTGRVELDRGKRIEDGSCPNCGTKSLMSPIRYWVLTAPSARSTASQEK